MNTRALWQTLKPLAPYLWLLVLWPWLVAELYIADQGVPVVLGTILTVLLASMFTALAALAQLALTEAARSVWTTYQYNVREQQRKAEADNESKEK